VIYPDADRKVDYTSTVLMETGRSGIMGTTSMMSNWGHLNMSTRFVVLAKYRSDRTHYLASTAIKRWSIGYCSRCTQ
jgi:hypothetical protein